MIRDIPWIDVLTSTELFRCKRCKETQQWQEYKWDGLRASFTISRCRPLKEILDRALEFRALHSQCKEP